ncbi:MULTISPECIES: type II toxin-antitoxin system HipA family toxin [unclassified Microbulbifer]|uniref:type II toxin-antitoxin system HipA family toxin n=1 Tax=unclassified Microbulbifer TaxID=2619833 RepID=UPI0027E3EFB0|nr:MULTISPECIES: type II toxin-antitoxin system HipA family toxin [unclassified Microbulbifer]
MATEAVEVLELRLHGVTLGHLAGYQGGRNILVFNPAYIADPDRPTFTLSGIADHPACRKLYASPWVRQQRLHPVLSNLLPEGALRDWFAQMLKVHPDNEFPLFAQLAADLPGALTAEPVVPEQIPVGVLDHRTRIESVPRMIMDGRPHFSLAGVQMKFSMHESDGRFNISQPDSLGEWIVKTPSTRHRDVPLNEYTAMKLAELVGVDIPEVKLIMLDQLLDLPPINLPEEHYAYAIRRYDRDAHRKRIHAEDFAQVLFKYAHEKYGSTNFEHIGRVVYQFTGHKLANTQQLARRLLVNILLGNGDAHLKNWSLIYPDQITAELAPAYDIVYTQAYIPGESQASLNLAGSKDWYKLHLGHFESWANSVSVPWRTIKPHLDDVMEKARSLWPDYLRQAPMNSGHKEALKVHWSRLNSDFAL